MSASPLHAVLGAGPAGSAIAAELLGHDVRVRQVSRGGIVRIDERVQTVEADLSTPEAAIAATEGASVIYHAVNVAYHLQVDLLPGITEAILAAAGPTAPSWSCSTPSTCTAPPTARRGHRFPRPERRRQVNDDAGSGRLDRPTSGRATVDGKRYASMAAPLREVGTLLDARATHPGRRAVDHLRALAATHRLPRPFPMGKFGRTRKADDSVLTFTNKS